MYPSDLIVSRLAITSTRITPISVTKDVIMTFMVEGVVLNFFFLGAGDEATPLTVFSSPPHNGEPKFRHL